MKTRLLLRACLGLAFGCATTAFPAQVTFQVNMSAQTALGNFNPSADGLFVAGDPINSWSTSASPLAPSPGNADIWTGTFEVGGTAGNTGQYKFLMITSTGTTWENNVGPGGATGNRTFTVADTDQTLPVVYFNNVTNSTSVSSEVTFQINMSIQIAMGNFDPSSGSVSVAGEFNAWSASAFVLTQSLSEPDLWVGTTTLSGAADSAVNYKFVMNGSSWEANVGTNGADNRALTLKSGAQTLPVVFFNNVAAIPTVFPLTFVVNMAAQIAQGNFDPTVGSVSVAGDPLNSWSPSASMLAMDATNNNLWTGSIEITNVPGGVISFKYVLNGSSWETSANRAYTIVSTNAQTLPTAFFNNVSDLGRLNRSPIVDGQMTLSWTAGPQIRLQSTTNLAGGVWKDVPNTLALDSAIVPIGTTPAFFKLVGP